QDGQGARPYAAAINLGTSRRVDRVAIFRQTYTGLSQAGRRQVRVQKRRPSQPRHVSFRQLWTLVRAQHLLVKPSNSSVIGTPSLPSTPGAKHGTVLRLHNGCRSDNPDCTWQFK